jgi:molecular chaperone GrpE
MNKNAPQEEGRENTDQPEAFSVEADKPDPSPQGPEVQELTAASDELAKLKEENASLKDQLLRKAADFDNIRKRMFKEKEESIKYANTQLLTDLVDIIDDFERAIASSESTQDFKTLHDGVVMIESKFVSVLANKYGLKRFESVGEAFDPNRHEAVMMEGSGEHENPTVLADFAKGYYLHDRVLRTAKVKVSQANGQ